MTLRPRCTGILPLLAALSFASTSFAETAFNPFLVPKEQVFERVRTVALRPLRIEGGIAEAARIRSAVEALVLRELEKNGYRALPSAEFDELWRRHAGALGGIYDAATGKPDDARRRLCYEHTARELERSRSVDAVVDVAVYSGAIPHGFAERLFEYSAWSLGEQVRWKGQLFTSSWPRDQFQHVEGLRIGVMLFDLESSGLYSASMPLEWRRIYWKRRHYDREEPVLSDMQKVQTALAALFDALRRPPADTPRG